MKPNDPIVLYIIIRQSLHLDSAKLAICAADAVQILLMKYFKLQLLSVKSHQALSDDNVKSTTNWLATEAKKSIVLADDDTCSKIKIDFGVNDIFVMKPCNSSKEIAYVFWPMHISSLPDYITTLI